MELNLSRGVDIIKKSKNIIIAFHKRPDGDCLASAWILLMGLKSLNKKCVIVSSEEQPQYLDSIINNIIGKKKELFISLKRSKSFKPDLIIVLDASNPERLNFNLKTLLLKKTIILNIDHHEDNTNFGNINIVDPSLPAVSIIIVNLLKKMGINLNKKMAELFFISIYSDTAGLTISHPVIPRMLLKIINAKADPVKLIGLLRLKKLRVFHLEGRVFSRIKKTKKSNIVWTWATQKDLKECHANYSDFESITEELSRIVEAKTFFFMKETANKRWRVSIRSYNKNVRKIAAEFGGGGHRHAAGFDISGTLNQAKQKILQLCVK